MDNDPHLLKVGEFVLNTESRKLYDEHNQEISLSPTLYTLLKCFIDHQNKILTREEIISHVWKDKIVVGANVNQNIKKLRDTLGDSVADPQYIETVTGEGFRFIANSEFYRLAPQTASSNKYFFYISSAILAVVAIALLVFLNTSSQPESLIKKLHPLTTLKGLEHNPDLSPDRKYILFNHRRHGSWDVYLKPISEESYHVILNSEADELFPVFSPDQSAFLYFFTNESECGLYMRTIDLESKAVGKADLVKPCENKKERYRAEWINQSEVFLSVNTDLSSPASIYHYNLKTHEQRLVSRPDSKGFGDYALKYSAEINKLAYIRNIGWSSSEIWVYDLESNLHNKIKSMPILLTELDWDSQGFVYFQSGNKTISKMQFDGSKEEVIAQFLSKVFLPFVIDDERIGVVIGDFRVVDIEVLDLKTNLKSTLISSNANDYYAAGGKGFLGFVSSRSGEPQVWLMDENNHAKQLTQFNKTYELKWLSASVERKLLIFNKSGVINIIDEHGNVVFDSINYSNQVHNNPVFNFDDESFLYSVQYDGEWNIESRQLESLGKKRVLVKGVTARPCINAKCILYFKEKDPSLYKYSSASNTSVKLLDVDYIRRAGEWAVYDQEHILYLHKHKGEQLNEVIKLNFLTGEKESLYFTEAQSFGFQRQESKLYTNIASQGNTDLMYFDISK
ncbi:winged helix-turn-helix domain-containing protein [Aliikangiella sp. IMCC44632]